ncbi:MAG: ABC transporter ATP-binding protein [Ktedonobacterales bacterium]
MRVRAVTKSFGRRAVLRGVSFNLRPGELAGIAGENGAGKSTLLKILAGELRPSGGSVVLYGALGYCPQAVVLNDELTVEQHLDYFRAAYGLTGLDRARQLVARLGYEHYCGARVGTLSGGTQQKLNLTLALMHDPSVLLLDEPYQGFDWETYQRFWELAAELRDRGRAVLVISHLLFDQSRFDRLYSLRGGLLESVSGNAAAATTHEGSEN